MGTASTEGWHLGTRTWYADIHMGQLTNSVLLYRGHRGHSLLCVQEDALGRVQSTYYGHKSPPAYACTCSHTGTYSVEGRYHGLFWPRASPRGRLVLETISHPVREAKRSCGDGLCALQAASCHESLSGGRSGLTPPSFWWTCVEASCIVLLVPASH